MTANHAEGHIDFQQGQTASRAQAEAASVGGRYLENIKMIFVWKVLQLVYNFQANRRFIDLIAFEIDPIYLM